MAKSWSVYIKPYLSHPETVVKYLSRYTYRIAISNHRIIKIDEQSVVFHWKDYTDNNRKKIMKLDGVEFLRRFLMHVLPDGFMRIRHFGFLANCVRQLRLTLLRQLLKLRGMVLKRILFSPVFKSDRVDCRCPSCQQGQMQIVAHLLSLKERRRFKLNTI